jgi:predicted transcriptional regulator
MGISWAVVPENDQDLHRRYDVLKDADVVQMLRDDPRDLVISDLLYYHPSPFPIYGQIDGGFSVPTVLAQLAVADLVSAGFVSRRDSGELELTEEGLSFAAARLENDRGFADALVREGAPPHASISPSLALALKHLILHGSDLIRHHLRDS